MVHHAGSVTTDASLVRTILARKVGSENALNSLCGQGWGQSWCNILQIINKQENGERSGVLPSLWSAMSQPATVRQKVDP
jgi:hypothetical protein